MEWMRKFWSKVPLFWRLAGPGLLMALGAVALLQGRPDGRLHLYFLSVGQGNAVLVVSPAGRAVLIDGGPDATALLTELGQHRPFWKPDLDLVLLTETAPERLAGPVAALERYRTHAAGRPGRVRPSSGWERWQALLAAQGLEAAPLEAGARFDLGDGVLLDVLFPGPAPLPQAAPGGSDDTLVLRLRYGTFSALLPTAAGPAGQQALLQHEADLPATVLLVPRQAGEKALDTRFLQATRPQIAIVSAGAGRHEGPDARTLDLLCQAGIPFYRTDRQGTVEVSSNGREVEVKVERAEDEQGMPCTQHKDQQRWPSWAGPAGSVPLIQDPRSSARVLSDAESQRMHSDGQSFPRSGCSPASILNEKASGPAHRFAQQER